MEKPIRKPDYKVSLLVIGDSYVGKTSLLGRFCEETFNEDYKNTVGKY